jgi:TPR repeat protein
MPYKYEGSIKRGKIKLHYHEGIANFNGENGPSDFMKAARHFEQGANLGDVDMRKYLGQMFLLGIGVPLDEKKGIQLLVRNANLGDPDSALLVGEFFLNKLNALSDSGEAIKWLLRTAQWGDNQAQFLLGDCYRFGDGVKAEIGKAIVWYRRAAQGEQNLDAMVALGVCYWEGLGLPKDSCEAFHLFRSAAKLGSANACFRLGQFYQNSDRDYSGDFSKALAWFEVGAIGGDLHAIRTLEAWYSIGLGVEKNISLAERWYSRANRQTRVSDAAVGLARISASFHR